MTQDPLSPTNTSRLGIAAIVLGGAVLLANVLPAVFGEDAPTEDHPGGTEASGPDAPVAPTFPREATHPQLAGGLAPLGAASLSRVLHLEEGEPFKLVLDQGRLTVGRSHDANVHVEVLLEDGAAPGPNFRFEEDRSSSELRVSIESRATSRSWFSRWFGSSSEEETVIIDGEVTPLSRDDSVIEHVRVLMPPGHPLRLATGAGDVGVLAHDAAVAVSSGAGDIQLEGIGGDIKAETGAGGIRVSHSPGNISAASGAGTIKVSEVAGHLDLATGAGAINISGSPASVDASSGAGSLSARLEGLVGQAEFSTGLGSVDVSLGAGVGFSVRAESGLGSAVLLAKGKRHEARGDGLRADVAGGGPLVRVESGMGSVRVETPEAVTPHS